MESLRKNVMNYKYLQNNFINKLTWLFKKE